MLSAFYVSRHARLWIETLDTAKYDQLLVVSRHARLWIETKTVAMRKWAWDYIDSVGVARGDVVMDLIADKLGIAPMENETT